jgi:hypothetical protein
MPNYLIPENPVYDAGMAQLRDSDPASATDTFNPLFQRLINNTHAVKKEVNAITGFDIAGAVGSYADLPDPAGLAAGTQYAVEADETHGGAPAVHEVGHDAGEGANMWRFLAEMPDMQAHAAALEGKADKEAGKGLSQNDYTDAERAAVGKIGSKANTSDLNAHAEAAIQSVNGVHGLRYRDDKFQIWNGSSWVDADIGGEGLPPLDIPSKTIRLHNGKLTLVWNDPNDITIEGTVVARWKGTKVVRKAGSYPASPTDGVLVVDNQARNAYASTGFTDNGLTNGTTYYYQLFPYTDTGAINLNPTNRITGVPQDYQIFGVSIDLGNSNPETAVTYTDAAIGKTPGAGWDSQAIFKDIKPCMLKDGVVQYYLNPLNFAQKEDGTAADIASGNDGDVMVEIPRIGFAIATDGDTLTVKITDDGADTSFRYYAHSRASEGDRSKLYIGAYLGFYDSSKLRSLSGKTPQANQAIGACRIQAQANGTGYDLVSFYPLTLLQCLYLIKFKSLDSQTALGKGYTGGSAAQATGATNSNGMTYGTTSYTSRVKFLGIEDMWGNLRWSVDGFWSDESRNMWTAFTGFNDTGSGYTDRGAGAATDLYSYMSKCHGTSEAGFAAKEASGSETTYFSDYGTLRASSMPGFGGAFGNGLVAGVFSLDASVSASGSSKWHGARLMYL